MAQRTDDWTAGGDIDVISPTNQVGKAFLGDTQNIFGASHVFDICRDELRGDVPLRRHVTGDEGNCSALCMQCMDDAEQSQRSFALSDAEGSAARVERMGQFAIWAIDSERFADGLFCEPTQTVVTVRGKEQPDAAEFCVDLGRKQTPHEQALLAIGIITPNVDELARLPVGCQLRCTEGNPMEFVDSARFANIEEMRTEH